MEDFSSFKLLSSLNIGIKMIFPIYNERALYLPQEKAIVIADLHIGIEYEYALQGVHIPSQTSSLLDKIENLLKRQRAEKLVILGDVKHIITASQGKEIMNKGGKEASYFLKKLDEIVDVFVVRGNHDGLLRSKKARIFGSEGIKFGDVAFAHGHAWPSEDIMDARLLAIGHIHPHVEIKTKVGYSYLKPCWVRGKFKKKEFLERYEKGNEKMEFIIMPAFNPLCGGIAVNRDEIAGPLGKIMDFDNAYVYLLEGINLGRISNLKKIFITDR